MTDLWQYERIIDPDPRVQEVRDQIQRVRVRLGAMGIGPLPNGQELTTPRQRLVDVLADTYMTGEGLGIDMQLLQPEVVIDLRTQKERVE